MILTNIMKTLKVVERSFSLMGANRGLSRWSGFLMPVASVFLKKHGFKFSIYATDNGSLRNHRRHSIWPSTLRESCSEVEIVFYFNCNFKSVFLLIYTNYI